MPTYKSRRSGIDLRTIFPPQTAEANAKIANDDTHIGKPKMIRIQTDADFTPAGKRRTKVTYGNRIRWYVSGRIHRTLEITAENIELSKRWVDRI